MIERTGRDTQSATARIMKNSSPPGVSKGNIFTDSPRQISDKQSSLTPSAKVEQLKSMLSENNRKDTKRPSWVPDKKHGD
jgi:hypothetical protein